MISLRQALLLGVVLVASYCFNISKYLFNSSSNKLASVTASLWLPQNETRTDNDRKQKVLQNNIFAFIMRDANRMVGIDPPFGMYIFDYINVHGESIPASSNQMQLYLNGRKIGVAPCEEYSIRCYKAKMLQIFHYVANYTQPDVFNIFRSKELAKIYTRDVCFVTRSRGHKLRSNLPEGRY